MRILNQKTRADQRENPFQRQLSRSIPFIIGRLAK